MTAIVNEVAALTQLGRPGLQMRWREVFKAAPPAAYTPDLLARGIAYRLQEKALGRLDPALARQLQSTGRGGRSAKTKLRPGNRLVRRWRGRTYVVDVIEEGFCYDQVTYGSLSEIATKITGTRWSGPRFFGLPK
ncbi:DUF2924 domain-containing protein [Sphingomonas sp. BN140010]|uniref:DUF2924 domain-containing protein n=1 Tax=Sphingomonas arvum TaxID=2992113 RepID=A0ABT3JDT6_9SPHN|nr:DUF2924 domain-containing protein [Sphingomonas sp. BN140010]MCW3797233.1 DUF2924 domain-containing protein [Sphingomonas sp. BN140010]